VLKALPRILVLLLGLIAAVAAVLVLSPLTLERTYSFFQHDNAPQPPVQIARGVYFVGSSDIASYAIDTGQGLILIDAGYEDTAPQVIANLHALGFSPRDVRILLNTHAHFDHAAGLAEIKRLSGAQLYASPLDAIELRRGGAGNFYLRDFFRYPLVSVDHELRDGEQVSLGNRTLTAHFTPGHTKGCTSWTFPVTLADGRTVQALVICSLSTLTFRLVDNPDYPNITSDYRHTYDVLSHLPCDVFLGAHGRWLDLEGKRARVARGEADAFYDPQGCRRFIAESRQAFEAEVARQGGTSR
jgi:metallo-beta-lactamase class B